MSTLLPWIMLPLVGAAIGYATNWMAIRMLFHPHQRRFGMQGLLPRRQADLARSIGRVVSDDLLSVEQLMEPLKDIDLAAHLAPIIDRVMERKVGEFRSIPLIGGLLTPERMAGLRDGMVREIGKHREEIMAGLATAADEHIDLAAIVEQRVAAFDLDQLERVVHRVARSEFRAIEIWGAVLGLLIGLVQALVLVLTAG
jgi:uncharacterized membrane protein YheB (UPF0754 family)